MEVETLLSDVLTTGKHQYKWNAGGLASGMYYYRIEIEGYSEAKKMMLMK
jgi:hypothetical protein